jgi:hypothetical protein
MPSRARRFGKTRSRFIRFGIVWVVTYRRSTQENSQGIFAFGESRAQSSGGQTSGLTYAFLARGCPGTLSDRFAHQVDDAIKSFQIMRTLGLSRIPNQSLTGKTPVAWQTFRTSQKKSQFVTIAEETRAKRSTNESSGTSDK